ncbi:MAG: alcohol dehydrogenase, partial [Solirubrobacteraceae bacterium]|nr:alcohol dehydrogenase [Solirubrobacteraceae bacterium]
RHNFEAIQPQLAQIAEALGRDISGLDRRAAAVAGVDAIDEVITAIELPPTLKDLGVQESDLAQIAKLSLNSKRLIDNNPVPLDLDAVTSIVHAAYAGDRTIR